MVNRLFDPGNLFWRIMARLVDFVGLSLFWAALSLPVITIGASTSALYYTVVKVFREGEEDGFSRMFKAFISNFKRSLLPTILCLALFSVMVFGYMVMSANWSSEIGAVMFVIYYIVLVIPAGFICYIFPILGRFEMGFEELVRTSVTLAIRHLPSTVVIVLLNVQLIIFTLESWFPIFAAPVASALLCSLFLERIFKKYIPEEESPNEQDPE